MAEEIKAEILDLQRQVKANEEDRKKISAELQEIRAALTAAENGGSGTVSPNTSNSFFLT